jgi:long-chain acyl-CoA synthetase
MLIVGGYKVFSVELEEKSQGIESIAMSAVVGQADASRPGNDIVNLFVELTHDAMKRSSNEVEIDKIKSEIIAFCREKMAPYKVPKAIHIIDAIPLTAVGKIDKKKLRQTL